MIIDDVHTIKLWPNCEFDMSKTNLSKFGNFSFEITDSEDIPFRKFVMKFNEKHDVKTCVSFKEVELKVFCTDDNELRHQETLNMLPFSREDDCSTRYLCSIHQKFLTGRYYAFVLFTVIVEIECGCICLTCRDIKRTYRLISSVHAYDCRAACRCVDRWIPCIPCDCIERIAAGDEEWAPPMIRKRHEDDVDF